MNETEVGWLELAGQSFPVRVRWEEDVDGATVRRVEVLRRKAVQYQPDGSTVMGRLEITADLTPLLEARDLDKLAAMVAHQ